MIITNSLGIANNLINVQTAGFNFCSSGDSLDVDFVYDEFYPKDIQIYEIPIDLNVVKKGDSVQEDDCDCLAGTFAAASPGWMGNMDLVLI